jgi:MFS family permease
MTMYSEQDLETAIAAGALTPEAVEAFRRHVSTQRSAPLVDEESFRLLTGFNDIFVAIALALLLAALAWIGGDLTPALGGGFVAAASWGLAEYFTARRRMALPSILLLLSFVGGVAATQVGALVTVLGDNADLSEQAAALIGAGVAAFTALSAFLHWRRFHVPITVAAGAVASVGVFLATVAAASTHLDENMLWFVLAAGLAVFSFAMWWDRQDQTRQTRRSDVAFWLHLAAAPLIAHPVFHLLGVLDSNVTIVQASMVVVLYLLFALVSLAIDRRALLVSSLAYVLYAMTALFERFGAVSMSFALTGLVIGSALLMLSAFWATARKAVVAKLPANLQGQLPTVDRALSLQPAS